MKPTRLTTARFAHNCRGIIARCFGAALLLWFLPTGTSLAIDVTAWGGNFDSQLEVPPAATNVMAIFAGGFDGVALRSDSSVLVWGNIPKSGGVLPGGALQPPNNLRDVVSVAAGDGFNIALKRDGHVIGWGANDFGPLSNLSRLSNVVAVSAGHGHALALTADGRVIGLGANYDGQLSFPADLHDAVAIAAANEISAVLRSDGSVIKAGKSLDPPPPEARDLTSISLGQFHAIALRADGQLIEWGYRRSDVVPRPNNLTGIVSIAAGAHHDLALRADGSVAAWGANWLGQAVPPSALTNVVSIAAGYAHSLALTGGGPPAIIQHPRSFNPFVGGNARLVMTATGKQPLAYQWRKSGHEIPGATRTVLALDQVSSSNDGDYDALVSNSFGMRTSSVATISVVPSPPLNITIQVMPSNRVGVLGGTALLSAFADGTPPLSFSWRRGNRAITNAIDPVLRMDHLSFADTANYSVVVSNAFGMSTSAVVRLSVVNVAVWGPTDVGSDARVFDVPPKLTSAISLSASQWDVLARLAGGSVAGWGDPFGQKLPVPPSAINLSSVAAGGEFSLGLRQDGTVLAWGDQGQGYGITTLPPGLTNVVQIQASYSWALALKADGTVIQWGTYIGGYMKPPPVGLSNVVQIAVGPRHALALLQDGTVTDWGSADCNQVQPPQGLSNVVAVAAADCYSMALREDGTVVEWGQDTYSPPPAATNLVAIATGNFHRVGLREDGKVFSWGFENGNAGQTRVPADLPPVFAITAAGDASFAIVPATGEPHIARQPRRQSLFRNQTFRLDTTLFPGSSNVFYKWFKDGIEIADEMSASLQHDGAQPSDSGFYYLVATNSYGTDRSRVVQVQVVNRPPLARARITPLIQLSTRPDKAFIIAPNNAFASVVLDGSASSDPDADLLEYSWFDQEVLIGTESIVTRVMLPGTHIIELGVSDGIDIGIDRISLEVVTPAQAVRALLLSFIDSQIVAKSQPALVASLNGAMAAFDRGNLNAAANQLRAFESKVRAQIAPGDPRLAETLLQATDSILQALEAN